MQLISIIAVEFIIKSTAEPAKELEAKSVTESKAGPAIEPGAGPITELSKIFSILSQTAG